MIFRKYFCNPGLLKNEFKRTKYIMLLHTVLLLLCTSLPAVLMNEDAVRNNITGQARITMLASTLAGANPFVMMAVAVASFGTAYFLFSYMFKKKSVIFYGSIPEKKSCIFTTKFIAAAFSLLIPVAVTAAVNVLLAYAFSVNEQIYILKHLGLAFFQYMFLLSAFVFAASLSGNFLSMLGTAGFGFLLYPLTVFSLSGNMSVWLKTYTAEFATDVNYMFPPIIMCGSAPENAAKYIIFETVLAVVLFALSVFFCTKRRAENVDNFFAFRAVNAIIKYTASVLCGLVIGCILTSDYTDSKAISFILYIVFAVLIYVILQAIFEKSFKAMFANIKHLAVFAVLFAVLISLPVFDVFNLDYRIPENPKSVTFNVTNDMDAIWYGSYTFTETFSNPDIINSVLALANESKKAAESKKSADDEYSGELRVKFGDSSFGFVRVFPKITHKQTQKGFSEIYDNADYKRALCKAVDLIGTANEYGEYATDISPECPYYTYGTLTVEFFDGLKKVLKTDMQKYSYADISQSKPFAHINTYGSETISLTVYDCYDDTVNYLLKNYFFIPALESIKIENTANGKTVSVTDLDAIKYIFRQSRGYYEEMGGNMCHIYAPTDVYLPDSSEYKQDFGIVADVYTDDLPEYIAAQLK